MWMHVKLRDEILDKRTERRLIKRHKRRHTVKMADFTGNRLCIQNNVMDTQKKIHLKLLVSNLRPQYLRYCTIFILCHFI